MRQVGIQLRLEFRILQVFPVGVLQLLQRRHQGLGHEAAAIDAEVPAFIRQGSTVRGRLTVLCLFHC